MTTLTSKKLEISQTFQEQANTLLSLMAANLKMISELTEEDIKNEGIDIEPEDMYDTYKYFEVFGVKYQSSKFVRNYVQFVKDVISRCGTRVLVNTLTNSNFTLDTSDFCESARRYERYESVGKGFYLNINNKNNGFTSKIKKICTYIDADIRFYN